MNQPVLVATKGAEGWLELSRRTRGQRGRLFEKHILSLGTLIHPSTGAKISIDKEFADTLISNFESGICDIVQVPLAGDRNEHTEDPNRNIGEVVGLKLKDNKIYATIDVRNEDAAGKLGKTLLGTSAFVHMNYTDTSTGKKVGPTLIHACVTNHPYLSGLDDYKEIIAATAADTKDDVVMMTNTEVAMPTKEELIAALKADHGIDVEGLMAQVASLDVAQLTNQIVEALKPAASNDTVALSNGGDVTIADAVGAVKELAGQHAALSEKYCALEEQVVKLSRESAEAEVARKVEGGFILPKAKNDMVELLLSNPTMYSNLLPESPIVAMEREVGADPSKSGAEHKDERQAEIDRYSGLL